MKQLADVLAGAFSSHARTPAPRRPGQRRQSAAERAAEAYAVLREADPSLPPLPPDAACMVDGVALPPRQRGPHRRSQPGAAWRIVPKPFWGQLVTALEGFERITRRPGEQGALKQSGVNTYRALVLGFLNPRTGQLDPSYEALADRGNVSRSTVAEAVKRLAGFGLIEVTRRVVPRPIRLMGRVVGRTWEQTSNAYRLAHGNRAAMLQAVPPEAQSLWEQWVAKWDALLQAIAAALQSSESDKPTETTTPFKSSTASALDSSLAAALDRLGEGIRRSLEGIAPGDAYGEPPKAAHF